MIKQNKCKNIAALRQSAPGQGLVEFALILVLVSLVATVAVSATGNSAADVFRRILGQMDQPSAPMEELPDEVSAEGGYPVIVVNSDKESIAGVQVFVLKDGEPYKDMNEITDTLGIARFELEEEDTYQFQAYHQGKFFLSEEYNIAIQPYAIIEIPTSTFTVTVANQDGAVKYGVPVLAYTDENVFCGTAITDFTGKVRFNLTEGSYKFRADYQSASYWSNTSYTPPKEVNGIVYIKEKAFTLTVVQSNQQGMPSMVVAAYREDGAYSGLSATTDASGKAQFNLAEGRYKFRTTYMDKTYWSNVFNLPADEQGFLQVAQGVFPVQVVDGSGNGISGATVYAFDASGSIAYGAETTDARGVASFELGAGTYKFRTTLQFSQYWSPVYTLFNDTSGTIKTGQTSFTVRVVDANGTGISGRPVAVYNASGQYIGVQGTTDGSGNVQFKLGSGSYKFRTEVQAQFYWSNTVSIPEAAQTTIETGLRAYTVTFVNKSDEPLKGVQVFVRRNNDDFTGQSGTTNDKGQVVFMLSEGIVQFRMDVDGKTYLSSAYHLPNDNPVTVKLQIK